MAFRAIACILQHIALVAHRPRLRSTRRLTCGDCRRKLEVLLVTDRCVRGKCGADIAEIENADDNKIDF